MNNKDEIIKCHLEVEFSIQYHVNRDLLKSKNSALEILIKKKGKIENGNNKWKSS